MAVSTLAALPWVDPASRCEDDGLVPRVVSTKTLTDQVSEIEKLIFDAQQQLSQATYALDTLKERIAVTAAAQPDDASARPRT